MLTSKKKGYRLSPETVDLLSQEFADSLTEAEADRKDILRLRLSLEEILESWSSRPPRRAGHLLQRKSVWAGSGSRSASRGRSFRPTTC